MANSITRQCLLDEAAKRGFRVETIGLRAQLCKVTTPKGETEMFSGSRPMRSSANGRLISVYKNLTLAFVESLGYQVPAYAIVDHIDEASRFLEQHGRIVVKPIDGSQSIGVTVGITTLEQLAGALELAQKNSVSGRVIVQKQIEGKLYRIFVLHGSVPVVTERRAAQVLGDGKSTLEQLVVELNADPRRGNGSDTPLKKVGLGAVRDYLGIDRLTSVPTDGKAVRISDIESVSAGGEAVNVTKKAHASWSEIACRITEEMGLYLAGFDIMCADISQPCNRDYLPLLEINSSPGFKIHEYPSEGDPVHLAPLLFDKLFSKT